MQSEAHSFYSLHVMPNVAEFRASLLDLRRAMNAAMVIDHMADHYWEAFKGDPTRVYASASLGAFRKELAKECPEWACLRSVAEAHKHVQLDRKNRLVTSASQTSSQTIGYGLAPYGTGPFNGESLTVQLDDGSWQHISHIVEQSVSFWEKLLGQSAGSS